MRGRSSTWTRIRVNLEHVPETLRPPQESLDPGGAGGRPGWRSARAIRSRQRPATPPGAVDRGPVTTRRASPPGVVCPPGLPAEGTARPAIPVRSCFPPAHPGSSAWSWLTALAGLKSEGWKIRQSGAVASRASSCPCVSSPRPPASHPRIASASRRRWRARPAKSDCRGSRGHHRRARCSPGPARCARAGETDALTRRGASATSRTPGTPSTAPRPRRG